MKFFVVFLLLFGAVLALATAAPSNDDGFPLLAAGGGIGGIFKGPNKETIIQGPDGSVITAENEPGIIVQSESLKEPTKPVAIANAQIETIAEPIETLVDNVRPIESVQTISQPIETVIHDVRPIATASLRPPVRIQPQIIARENLVSPLQEVFVDSRPTLQQEFETVVEDGPILEQRKIVYAPQRIESRPLEAINEERPRQILLAPEPQRNLVAPKYFLSTASPSYSGQSIAWSSTPAPPVLSSTLSPSVLSSTLSPSVLSSTVAPGVLSSTLGPHYLSSTLAPEEGVSSGVGAENLIDSSRINLGSGDIRLAIPVVEYASSNGFVNNARSEIFGVTSINDEVSNNEWVNTIADSQIENDNIYSTNHLPPITAEFDKHHKPFLYKRSTLQQRRQIHNRYVPNSYMNMRKSHNIQKIPKNAQKGIRIDDRIDMGHEYRAYRDLYDRNSDTIQLPPALRRQLAQYLPKNRKSYDRENKGRVVIDGKMGDLSQNEIQPPQQLYTGPELSAVPQRSFLPFPLQLSSRPNVEVSNRNTYQMPLDEIANRNLYQIPQGGINGLPTREILTLEDRIESDLWNRYGRDTKKSKK